MIDHEHRRTRIGGSEVAAVLGCDERRDAYSLWAFKRRLYEREPMTLRMRLGQVFEPGILQVYAEHTGRELEPSGHMVHSLVYPFMVYSPDALCKGERRGVDAKFVGWDQLHRWGEASDEIPNHIQLQCLWYMAAMDYDFWDVAVVTSNCDLRIYTYERDCDFERWVLQRADEWWRRYLIGNGTPPPGSLPETSYAIKQMFPRNREKVKRATVHQVALLESYAAIGKEWDVVNNRFIEIENALKVEVGNSDGLEWPGGKFTWKATKDTQEIHWDGLAAKLLKGYSPDERAAIIQEFTETKHGSRRVYFRTKEAMNAR
jgi:predicted phage-related endonuclease